VITAMSLDSDLLRTFVAIADTGGFTAAADVVGRTQSAVSMQMKRLEESIGSPLFHRRGRGLSLTTTGETLLSKGRRVLAMLDETAAAVSGEALGGTVRIGIADEYGSAFLPGILARFAELHPSVQVTVSCGLCHELQDNVAAGHLDLAVEICDSALGDGELLGHEPTVWAVSSRHSIEDCDPLPLALFNPGCWWHDDAIAVLERAGRAYRVAYTSASIAGVAAAIGAGLAVGILGLETVPAGARVLTPSEGFDELPPSRIILRRNPGARSAAVDGMAAALRQAFLRSPSDRLIPCLV
jgi:DNA-binding transcriptional LysR family regulator